MPPSAIHPRRCASRSFTLLETLLATVIGAMVLLAALGLFESMQRGEAQLERRMVGSVDLARLRRAAQSAMLTVVMAGYSAPAATGASQSPEPPRFVLQPDPRAELHRAVRYGRLAGGRYGLAAFEPQRLELVLRRAPVVRTASALSADPPRRIDPADQPAMIPIARTEVTVRGAFELWPDGYIAGTAVPESAWLNAEGLTLWWRPIRPEQLGSQLTGPGPDDVPLATGLVLCQWFAFRKGERITELTGRYVLDLPGYVELLVRTRDGQIGNWMLELAYDVGEEKPAESPADQTGLPADEPDQAEPDAAGPGTGRPGGGSGMGGSGR